MENLFDVCDDQENQGYHVEAVNSGDGAIRALDREKFDVMVLDLKMPGMDGITTLKEVKKLNRPSWRSFCAFLSVLSSVYSLARLPFRYRIKRENHIAVSATGFRQR